MRPGNPASMPMGASMGSHRYPIHGFMVMGDGSTQLALTGGATAVLNGAAGNVLRVVALDTHGEYSFADGIFRPKQAGYYCVGSSVGVGPLSGAATVASYIEHSADGSVWTDLTKRRMTYRGTGVINDTIGGSGSSIIYANGSTDRWRLTIYLSAGTGVKVPSVAANADWSIFFGYRIGE